MTGKRARGEPIQSSLAACEREVGERLVFPLLTVTRHAWREIRFNGIEQTVHDYDFRFDEQNGWRIVYSGQHHFSWKVGVDIALLATIKEQQPRWRCIVISRPIELKPSNIPLFER